jgi:hypothetical protein
VELLFSCVWCSGATKKQLRLFFRLFLSAFSFDPEQTRAPQPLVLPLNQLPRNESSASGTSPFPACYKFSGRRGHLFNLTWGIFNLRAQKGISLSCHHIPGKVNQITDQLSKEKRLWRLVISDLLWEMVDQRWGPNTADQFASSQNTRTPLHPVEDTFSQSWLNENNFLCPPFHLLPLVIRHLKWLKAKATLIAPIWQNQIWFQQLLSMLINKPLMIHHWGVWNQFGTLNGNWQPSGSLAIVNLKVVRSMQITS